MKARKAAIAVAGGVGVGVAAAAAGRKLGQAMTWRTRRLWRLTARNAGRYAGTKARGVVTPAERRAELDLQFAIRTAEDVAKELGEMKGVLMKVGQLVSFIVEALPDEAQAALVGAAGRRRPDGAVAGGRGRAPGARRHRPSGSSRRGTTCPSPRPASARSTGPAARTAATLAVKVQFPGVSEAIEEDLDGAEVMYSVFSALALQGLDYRSLVDELRARMREELDYRREAANLDRVRQRLRRPPVGAHPGPRARAVGVTGADDRVGRRDGRGTSSSPPPRTRPSSAPAR